MPKSIIIESFDYINKRLLNWHIRTNSQVYVIEPFVAYHRKRGMFSAFPKPFPAYVEKLLQKGVLKILTTTQLGGKTLYLEAADRAVEIVEAVFEEYKREHSDLFQFVSDTLKSSAAEDVFRIKLCDSLAEVFSVNILLLRIEEFLGQGRKIVYPDANVRSYLYMKKLIVRCNQEFFPHPSIRFPYVIHMVGFLENLRKNIVVLGKLFAQTIASGLFVGYPSYRKKNKNKYSYGVAITSPVRQLRDNKRGPDFIVDDKKIQAKEVVYFPLVELTAEQQKVLDKLPGAVYHLPKAGRFFSNFREWRKLFFLSLRKKFLRNMEEVNAACGAFFYYFMWAKIMKEIGIRYFISHCDYGIAHIGRNLALNQAGAQTWYFTDSMNFGCNLKDEKNGMRHPNWTNLHYDHFVTWSAFLSQYFKSHPRAFKKTHIVGCLWAGHIGEGNVARSRIPQLTSTDGEPIFIIAAFDTTYSRNGIASYEEAIAFAEHLMILADTFQDIQIFLKEKKDRSIHRIFDPINGPKLTELYCKMNSHPRISVDSSEVDRIAVNHGKISSGSSRVDATDLISSADMVISFPFTSTTFEALSVNKPAVWHDPLGYYKNTPYGRIGGVTTHSYDELEEKILEIKDGELHTYQNPIPINSPLSDPYRDGKAIERFRDLLISE
jgi:polysaccharide biosynthesis PFTS motif protein